MNPTTTMCLSIMLVIKIERMHLMLVERTHSINFFVHTIGCGDDQSISDSLHTNDHTNCNCLWMHSGVSLQFTLHTNHGRICVQRLLIHVSFRSLRYIYLHTTSQCTGWFRNIFYVGTVVAAHICSTMITSSLQTQLLNSGQANHIGNYSTFVSADC